MQIAVHLALIVVQLCFTSLAIIGRHVLPHVPAGVLVTLRVLGAAAVFLLLNLIRRGAWVRDRRDLGRLAAAGLLGISANQTLFLFGLRHTTAINATILVTTTPIFTVLGSVMLRREPPSAAKLAGIALAAIGTIYLIGPDRISLAPDVALGNALIVAGMICYASYFLVSEPISRRYDAITVNTYVMLFGIVGILPFGAIGIRHLGSLPGPIWGWVAYIVAVPTVVAYLLNIWALRRASSNMVAVYIYLQPIMAALVAPLVLEGERLTPRAAVAGVAIFAGLITVIRAEQRQRRQIPQPLPAE